MNVLRVTAISSKMRSDLKRWTCPEEHVFKDALQMLFEWPIVFVLHFYYPPLKVIVSYRGQSTTAEAALGDERLGDLADSVGCAFLQRELADYLVNLDQFHHSLWGIHAFWVILPINPSKSEGLSPLKILGTHPALENDHKLGGPHSTVAEGISGLKHSLYTLQCKLHKCPPQWVVTDGLNLTWTLGSNKTLETWNVLGACSSALIHIPVACDTKYYWLV